jgi:hypothetical protein
MSDACSWCGGPVADGYRLIRGDERAAFCRLEHVVPWMICGPRWEPAPAGDAAREAGEVARDAGDRCAQCGTELGDDRIVMVRERGEHRIADALCSSEHVLAWAQSGGRYATR